MTTPVTTPPTPPTPPVPPPPPPAAVPQRAPVAGQRKPRFLPQFLRDLATLQKPVTAASITALVVELSSPLGLNVGPWGSRITAVLVAVGVVSAYVEHRA